MADLLGGTHVGGNLTLDGTVDGVDLAAFKSAYDSHNHDSRYLLESGDTLTGVLDVGGNDLKDGTTVLWDASAGYVPQGRLQNDSVSVNAGNQLSGGGSVALGGSVTLDLNEGSGSGLDADMLDGKHGGDYVLTSGDLITGELKVDAVNKTDHPPRLLVGSDNDSGQVDIGFEVRGNQSGGSVDMSSTNDSGDTKFAILGDGSTYIGYSNLASNSKTTGGPYLLDVNGDANFTGILNEQGNRVATRTWVKNTSTLGDADTVDGQHASAFASSGHTHDGRYVMGSGDTMSGDLHFPEDVGAFKGKGSGNEFGYIPSVSDYSSYSNSGNLPYNDGTVISSDAMIAFIESDNDAIKGYIDTNAGDLEMFNQIRENGNRVATRTWTNNNADVPNADYADNAGDADTLDGYHAGELARTKNLADLTSTDTSTDYNATSWQTVSWNAERQVDGGYTHSTSTNPDQVTIDSAGTYRVTVQLSYDASGTRVVPGVKFALNGTRLDPQGLGGYVRNRESNDQGSTEVTAIISASAGDVLTVQTYAMGDTGGSLYLRSNESSLLIEQLSQTTSTASDADMVDGLHASDFVQKTGSVMSGELEADAGIRVSRGGLDANNSIEAKGTQWLGLDSGSSGNGVLIGYYNAPEVRIGTGSTSVNVRGTLTQNSNAVATESWVNSNADVPNADYADSAGDADTLDGSHASAFASSGHTHDGRYILESGDAMAGNLDFNGNQATSLNRVQFQNIETVNDGELGRDDSMGYIGNWGGNGMAVLWDSHNVTGGNQISISGGTGDESLPTISVNESGLDADTLDGSHASAFASSGHTHDGRYYTESEADSNFASSGHTHDSRYINEGDAIPHPVYATKSDIPALAEGESAYVSGDGLYIEDGT